MPHESAKQAMQSYLQALTHTEEAKVSDELAAAARLLETANQALLQESPEVASDSAINEIDSKEIAIAVETVNREAKLELMPLKQKLPPRFHALFFEVAGLTLAIPLVELGGIIALDSEINPSKGAKHSGLSPMPGQAQWLMGVLVKLDQKYNCVDTARWIMPEKYTQALADSLNYAYAVQLGKTPWVLACSKLADTHELSHDDIKWRDQDAKRPWLAGMIKQKMCALVDASQLIRLLEARPTKNASSVVTE
ncbi:chemotaxis protein CheW [Glaciecola siphonariae]|uniref:Chemotaxis protein CheW n=1 Tax=Glaciecola siphonariae TaxID=521012 RepID=A0ABV9LTR4_9ALTE